MLCFSSGLNARDILATRNRNSRGLADGETFSPGSYSSAESGRSLHMLKYCRDWEFCSILN